MAVIGTFGSFTAARLGIYASQAALNATGNNIANINTEGYTRQRMDLVSLYGYGGARYANSYQVNIGYGVLTNGVSQLRDPFLDIRYREENAKLGAYDEKLDCLQQLANILDEVGRGTDDFGIIEAQFSDFLQQLENLNGKVGSVEYDTTARGSALTLTQLFNSYATAMDTLASNKLKELKENVNTVNTLLEQIRDLNVQIRDAGIVGDQALELRDARNLCIDQLSSYMNIEVSYDMEKIDEFNSVERINIKIAGGGPLLVRGVYAGQISMPDYVPMRNPSFDPDATSAPENRRYAYFNADGDLEYTNFALNPNYNPSATSGNESKKYMYYNPETGTHTYLDEDELAAQLTKSGEEFDDVDALQAVLALVPNASEKEDEISQNRLWMSVEPLTDAKGRYMRDENHKELREAVDLGDNDLFGSLQSLREFLTEKGEFSNAYDLACDPQATQKRGIQYYQNALDALARKFADAFNKANQLDLEDVSKAYVVENGSYVDSKGNPITITFTYIDDNGDEQTENLDPSFFEEYTENVNNLEDLKNGPPYKNYDDDLSEEEKKAEIERLEKEIEGFDTRKAYAAMEALRSEGAQLNDDWKFYNGGVLFSSNGDTDNPNDINAKNITISHSWMIGDVRILNTKKADGLDHSTANDNIYHMIQLMSEDMDYYPGEGTIGGLDKKYFTGSFQERLADMSSILGVDMQTTTLLYNEYATTTLSLENSRQSVAGVDLNDEATNMMMYQKAYAAACKLMTTLDSMLDRLINGTI